MLPADRVYHFSVDDVFAAFVEVSDAGSRLTDHLFFAFLAELHAQFHTVTDLYLFAEHEVAGTVRSLGEVSDRNRAEFENLDWLRLGPHALDFATPPHRQPTEVQRATLERIYAEIDRFGGSVARSRWLRLHYFSESYECADYLRGRGVDGLLLTDKDACAYRLPVAARDELRRHGWTRHAGLDCVRSHLRLEKLVEDGIAGERLERQVMSELNRHGFVVLFTHEEALRDPRVRDAARSCVAFLRRLGIASV